MADHDHHRQDDSCRENFPFPYSAEPSSAMTLPELKDALPEKPRQCHPSEVAVPRAAPRGRFARSKAGWASKERSTPEGYNREKHAWRFESPFSQGMSASSFEDTFEAAFADPVVIPPPKAKKSPEEKNAIRGKRIAQRERASQRHIETFELVETTVKCLFFEFGGGCYHYNFTAKPGNHHSAAGGTMLFFAEINCPLRCEDDVLLCSIVGERDAGHCYACKNYRPMMVHPSSRAYGGGNTTAIDYPDEDSSSSDSDY
ncbi:hypothetical protein ACP70R_018312 [Stipagrostis hirtigluma subsp. patula]